MKLNIHEHLTYIIHGNIPDQSLTLIINKKYCSYISIHIIFINKFRILSNIKN